jgi:hypothetical protein
MPGKIGRLLALSDAEFSRRRKQPTKLKTFKARPIDVRTFDRAWERYRGAAVRVMAVVLREDSDSLYAKVTSDAKTMATFTDAIGWLQKEAELLRKTAERHELAASRLKSTICRYRASQQQRPAESTPPGWQAGAP